MNTDSSSLPEPIFVPKSSREGLARLVNQDIKGWDYLFNLLIEEGVNPLYAARVVSDSRMPKHETVYFSARPKESHNIYKKVNTQKARDHAMRFFNENAREFRIAEDKFNVPASVILAILQVESNCGDYTGRERVFYRLARLVTASDPASTDDNLEYNKKFFKDVTRVEVKKRATWLKETFLPHLIGTVVMAEKQGLHPLEIRGSGGGGIGLPQFLPGNVKLYGVDADGDRVVDLEKPGDSILSVAKFLKSSGWNGSQLNERDRRKVILEYNQSQPYVNTVLSMADQLREMMIRESRRKRM